MGADFHKWHKFWAVKMIVLGILVLVWNWYLTGMLFGKDWPTFIGVLLIAKGLCKLAMPAYSCCATKPAKKKK